MRGLSVSLVVLTALLSANLAAAAESLTMSFASDDGSEIIGAEDRRGRRARPQRRLAAARFVTGRLRRPHLTPAAVAPHGPHGLRLQCPGSYGELCWRLPRAAQVCSACELQSVYRGDPNRSPCMVAKDVVSEQ
jgi:hypothetical protein